MKLGVAHSRVVPVQCTSRSRSSKTGGAGTQRITAMTPIQADRRHPLTPSRITNALKHFKSFRFRTISYRCVPRNLGRNISSPISGPRVRLPDLRCVSARFSSVPPNRGGDQSFPGFVFIICSRCDIVKPCQFLHPIVCHLLLNGAVLVPDRNRVRFSTWTSSGCVAGVQSLKTRARACRARGSKPIPSSLFMNN